MIDLGLFVTSLQGTAIDQKGSFKKFCERQQKAYRLDIRRICHNERTSYSYIIHVCDFKQLFFCDIAPLYLYSVSFQSSFTFYYI